MMTDDKEAAASQSQSQSQREKNAPQSTEYQLRKYLLLLATLVATVTYAGGLNLPGGVWQDSREGHPVGDPILPDTQHRRYLVFYYCNATAFTASLVVCLLVLGLDKKSQGPVAVLLRLVMLLDLLALMGAYAAGSCRDRFTTIYSLLLMSTVFAYIMPALVAFAISKLPSTSIIKQQQDKNKQQKAAAAADDDDDPSTTTTTSSRREEMHETLMLLTTFAVAVTYVAGLNPPGGFWGNTVQQGGGRALPQPPPDRVSQPVLKDHHPMRYQAFFVCNTTAFVVSLIIIMLLMDKKLTKQVSTRFVTLYVLVVVALLGLVGAYVAGSSRESDNTAYVIGLGIAVLACILLQLSLKIQMRQAKAIRAIFDAAKQRIQRLFVDDSSRPSGSGTQEETSLARAKSRELVMLLATLAASITYQAGLDPPGGLWQDDQDGHRIGESVLLTTNPTRYMVFFYSNSAAFVASLVVIMMVQSRFLLQRHTLEAAMILDLFGLICAYAAGSCRDVSTSVYVVALAGVVLVYVVIHIIFFFTLDPKAGRPEDDPEMDNKREVLLLLAILVATLTYQAGLTPPGGFWPATTTADESGGGHHYAGYPVLLDNYPKRYKAFFYCNAASFMTSVALILLLVNPTLYKIGIQCYALYVCMVAGMFGLVGAYTAGSSRRLRTSIYVLVLAIGLFVFVTVQVFIYWRKWKCRRREVDVTDDLPSRTTTTTTSTPASGNEAQGEGGGGGQGITGSSSNDDKQKRLREYLMLLGILAASVTYQTGLKPPGGLWPDDDSSGHVAGDPVLHDINKRRYLAFFYSNSTSFVASIVVIVLLLPSTLHGKHLPLWPMHTAILLDMLGLLAAYAAGSNRDMQTTKNVIGLVIPVLAYIAAYPVYSFVVRSKRRNKNASLIHLPQHGTTTWEPRAGFTAS